MAGITGEIETNTGTPAAASVATAASRFSGCGARGSSVRAIVGSSDVTDRVTLTSPFAAIGTNRSISCTTRSDLVVMVSGWFVSASTAMQSRAIRHSRSIG